MDSLKLPCARVQTEGALFRPIINWDATYLDAALLLDILTGNASSPYRESIKNYLLAYAKGDGSGGIQCAPRSSPCSLLPVRSAASQGRRAVSAGLCACPRKLRRRAGVDQSDADNCLLCMC